MPSTVSTSIEVQFLGLGLRRQHLHGPCELEGHKVGDCGHIGVWSPGRFDSTPPLGYKVSVQASRVSCFADELGLKLNSRSPRVRSPQIPGEFRLHEIQDPRARPIWN